jgi:hypothetical protein
MSGAGTSQPASCTDRFLTVFLLALDEWRFIDEALNMNLPDAEQPQFQLLRHGEDDSLPRSSELAGSR